MGNPLPIDEEKPVDVVRTKAEALFAEFDAPTHCTRQEVHGQLTPITRATAAMRKQVLEYQMLIQEMENAAPDPSVYPILEHMHQTFGSIERNAQVVAMGLRQLSLDFVQLDRYMAQQKGDIEARHPKEEGASVREAEPVVP